VDPAPNEPHGDGAATPAAAPGAPDPGDRSPDEADSRQGYGINRGCLLEIARTLGLTIVVFLVIQTFVVQPFQVKQFSMERTFEEGDFVLVDRLTPRWDPYDHGEVVVFEPPEAWAERRTPYIKRVIGVAGDTVEVLPDGSVTVNGVVLDEPYLYRDEAGTTEPTVASAETSWVVPDGQLFVMGDHRQESSDSRIFGPIPVSSVIGRGMLRYWPISAFWIVETPTYAP
jgi:signal peptidase I